MQYAILSYCFLPNAIILLLRYEHLHVAGVGCIFRLRRGLCRPGGAWRGVRRWWGERMRGEGEGNLWHVVDPVCCLRNIYDGANECRDPPFVVLESAFVVHYTFKFHNEVPPPIHPGSRVVQIFCVALAKKNSQMFVRTSAERFHQQKGILCNVQNLQRALIQCL